MQAPLLLLGTAAAAASAVANKDKHAAAPLAVAALVNTVVIGLSLTLVNSAEKKIEVRAECKRAVRACQETALLLHIPAHCRLLLACLPVPCRRCPPRWPALPPRRTARVRCAALMPCSRALCCARGASSAGPATGRAPMRHLTQLPLPLRLLQLRPPRRMLATSWAAGPSCTACVPRVWLLRAGCTG